MQPTRKLAADLRRWRFNQTEESAAKMAKLGSEKRPIVVRVHTDDKAWYVAETCAKHGWHYIIGFEPDKPEDISDLQNFRNFRDAPVFMCCKRKQIVLSINYASQSPHRCPGCLAPCHLP